MSRQDDRDKKEKKTVPKVSQCGDIEAIRSIINTEFEARVACQAVDRPAVVMPTGILSMDLAIGNGGMLGGRIVDIHGWEATGKTLTCMTIGGYVQRCTKIVNNVQVNRVVAFLDAEGTFSAAFATSCGMDASKVLLVQSTEDKILTGEDYFDILVLLLGQGVDYIIVDSCPALTPSTVMINEMGHGLKAAQSQLMSQGLMKIVPLVNCTKQSIVHFINQKRGRPMAGLYQPSESETGGNALKFYSSYRLCVVRSVDIFKNVLGVDGEYRKKKVGVNSCIRILKNKTASEPSYLPGTTYHFDFDVYFEEFKDDEGIEYSRGVDIVRDSIQVGVRMGVVVQSGSWFSFGEVKGQGEAGLVKKIRERPELLGQIRAEVFSKAG